MTTAVFSQDPELQPNFSEYFFAASYGRASETPTGKPIALCSTARISVIKSLTKFSLR